MDFDRLPEDAPWWAVDAVVSALGTALKAAGSQAAFYRVVPAERIAHHLLVSALAAAPGTRVLMSDALV